MNATVRRSLVLTSLLGLAGPAVGQAGEHGPGTVGSSVLQQLDHAVGEGHWWLRLRYRLENVDQDGFTRDAWASTLRTVLGYQSAPWHGVSAVLEFEDVSVVGNELYNSTVNGKGSYPIVADPDGSEVNQAHLEYVLTEEVTAKLGRQVILLDNTRFVGDVAWRQNQQTYDAVSVLWRPLEALKLFYAFVDNVNRVFGEDSPQGDHRMGSHLVNAGYELEGLGLLSGYAYLLDYDAVETLSSNTYGLRFVGDHELGRAELLYAAEYATQSDASGNPNDVDQDYRLLELGVRANGFTLKAGQEVLGGSGDPGDAFQTPLATLHAFNGWADQFLTTPDAGLQDLYLALGKRVEDLQFQLVWHDFQADAGSTDYGTELDASLTWAVGKKVVVGLTLADYQADTFAVDTTKAWLWLAYAP
jgi:hypothetical protein